MVARERVELPASFNRLAWSNLAAQSAEQIALVAAPMVAVLTLGAGAGGAGLLQTAQTLPFLLLAIPAGLLADRVSRRGLMASAEALRVGALLGVLVFAQLGWLSLPALAFLGFVGACGTVAYSVTAPALVPALVPAAALAAANARVELARTVAFAGGPALAGALVGWTGEAPAFGVAAALSAVAVVLLSGLREPARPSRPGRGVVLDLREGAAFVFTHRLLQPVFVVQFVFTTASFVLQAVYVPHAVHHLGLSASAIGVILAAYGGGLVTGALLAGLALRALPFGTAVAIGPVCGLAAALVMVATLWVPSAMLASLSFFLLGVGPILWVISTGTLRQAVTPGTLLGRVSAIFIAGYGSRPLGAAIGAYVGGVHGIEAALVVAAIGFGAQALITVTSPLRRLITQPEMASPVAL